MGSVVISGATSGAVTLAVPDEAGTRTLTLPATTGTILTNDISQAGDTSAGNAAAVGYTSAEGLILTGQGSTSDVTIKNDADATVISIPTGTTQVGIGTTTPGAELGFPIGNDVEISQVATTAHQAGNAGHIALTIADGGNHAGFFVNNTHDGTYSDTHLSFKTGEGGVSVSTERMRITPNGKVGIGTSAPETNLHVFKASSGASTDSSAVVHIENSGTTVLQLSAGTSNDCHIAFGDSGNQNIGSIAYANNGNHMAFRTDNAERMRITSGGILQIAAGSASPTTEVFRIGTNSVGSVPLMTASFPGNAKWLFNTNDTAGQSGGRHHTYFSNGGEVGSVTTTTSATAYNTSSDYRLKENVSYTFDATTRLKQLKPARFNFKVNADSEIVDGFLAHEVSSIVPEAVTGTKDAVDENGDAVYQGIDQSKLVPLLVKTIQELEARITALEAG